MKQQISARKAARLQRLEFRKHAGKKLRHRPWYIPAGIWGRIVALAIKAKSTR